MRTIAVARAFLRKDFMEKASYRLQFLLGFVGIFVGLFFFNFVSRQLGDSVVADGHFFEFLVFGMIVYSFSDVALRELSRLIRNAQLLGTFEALLATQTPLPIIVFALPLHTFAWLSFRVLVYLIAGVWFFDMKIVWSNWPAALPIIALTIACFGAMGLAMAALTVAFKKTEQIVGLVGSLSLLLGGVFYPVEKLPSGIQYVSKIFPITHGLAGIRRALIDGAPWTELMGTAAVLGVFLGLLLPIGALLFQWSIRRALRDGTLTQY